MGFALSDNINGLHPGYFIIKMANDAKSKREMELEHTFMLYGYNSRADETPPEFFTSYRHFRNVRS
jgi:hypothetical protein